MRGKLHSCLCWRRRNEESFILKNKLFFFFFFNKFFFEFFFFFFFFLVFSKTEKEREKGFFRGFGIRERSARERETGQKEHIFSQMSSIKIVVLGERSTVSELSANKSAFLH